ncbi:hypothetical protein SEA_ABBYDAISY_72 [Arthrobacter phage AbbyDaisy]|nr:hypothetical protein SEA_ABBYDAISY_72 [Arthrobacter phage AbbyDaisy]
MLTTITTTVEHGSKTYSGRIGTIKRTSFGFEDHGIVTAYLHVEWPGGGIGAGGYTLDSPRKNEDGKHVGRFGSAYGMDHIMRILETVGVDTWEKLPGKQVIVLFEGPSIWGSTSCGIAGITTEKVLDFKAHYEAFAAEVDD